MIKFLERNRIIELFIFNKYILQVIKIRYNVSF